MDVKSCYSALSVEWRTTNRVPPSLPPSPTVCVMSGDSWSRLRESLATIDHLLSHALRPLLTSSLCCCARALNTAVIIITIQRPASAGVGQVSPLLCSGLLLPSSLSPD